MQKPFLFPIISVIYLEPKKPLNLGVLRQRTQGRAAVCGTSVGALLIYDQLGPGPACVHHGVVWSMLFSVLVSNWSRSP